MVGMEELRVTRGKGSTLHISQSPDASTAAAESPERITASGFQAAARSAGSVVQEAT